jgi:hypothetical protein
LAAHTYLRPPIFLRCHRVSGQGISIDQLSPVAKGRGKRVLFQYGWHYPSVHTYCVRLPRLCGHTRHSTVRGFARIIGLFGCGSPGLVVRGSPLPPVSGRNHSMLCGTATTLAQALSRWPRILPNHSAGCSACPCASFQRLPLII